MPRVTAFRFADRKVVIPRAGSGEVLSEGMPGTVERRGDIVAWDPGVDGLVGGVETMDVSSDHGGERHLDGDELLYVTAGRMTVVVELGDGTEEEVAVGVGEAVFVPQELWHRLRVDAPVTFAFLGGGRTEIRVGDV